MNSLDDLMDRLNELRATLWSQLEENSTFNTLREKFETLSGSTQKLVIAGSISFIIFLIISIPLSSLLDSSDYVSEFDEKRVLIERLQEANQNLKKGSPIPPGLNTTALETNARRQLQTFRLIEGQGPTMTPLNNDPAGKLVPEILTQAGLQISLKGLNLKQTINIGRTLDNLHPSVKMIGMDVVASADFPKYYDVIYRLVSFTFPQPESTEPEKARGGRDQQQGKGRKRGK